MRPSRRSFLTGGAAVVSAAALSQLPAVHSQEFGTKLCAALGLDPHKVQAIDLHIEVNDIVTATVRFAPSAADLEPELKRYRLVEVQA